MGVRDESAWLGGFWADAKARLALRRHQRMMRSSIDNVIDQLRAKEIAAEADDWRISTEESDSAPLAPEFDSISAPAVDLTRLWAMSGETATTSPDGEDETAFDVTAFDVMDSVDPSVSMSMDETNKAGPDRVSATARDVAAADVKALHSHTIESWLESLLSGVSQDTRMQKSEMPWGERIHSVDQSIGPGHEDVFWNGPAASSRMQHMLLEDLDDNALDSLHKLLFNVVTEQGMGATSHVDVVDKKLRHKHVDGRRTIRHMTRTGGIFTDFSYRESPSKIKALARPRHLLVIGDVSGSMGRYVAILLVVLSCLEQVAEVDSYVFSDSPTYVNPLLGKGSFRHQFERLKSGSTSWEYGTRLNLALQTVLGDSRFQPDTTAVLVTDGGFSLSGEDWQQTVGQLEELSHRVAQLLVVTPNPGLVVDGPDCVNDLWRVRRMSGSELMTPVLQKTARFGLLAEVAQDLILCQTPEDVRLLLQRLVNGP